jgi:hypothetical protein
MYKYRVVFSVSEVNPIIILTQGGCEEIPTQLGLFVGLELVQGMR